MKWGHRMKFFLMISISVMVTFVMTGCSQKMSEVLNDDIDKMSNSKEEGYIVGGVKMPDLLRGNKDSFSKNNFVSFKNSISLKKALKMLGKIDRNKYYLDRDSENVIVPTSNYRAKNFSDIANYLEDTMGKTIYISKNAIFKDRLKVVKLRDAKANKYNFETIPFKLNMDISVIGALQKLKKNSEFLFSINVDFEDFEVQKSNRLFEDVAIAFKGTSVSEFFKYLEQKLNVFVDVDYDSKIVRIHKYSKQFFQINVDNKVLTGTTGGEDTAVTLDSEVKDAKINEKLDIDIYSKLKSSLDAIIVDAKVRKNANSYYHIDEQTGSLEAYADRRTMERVQEKVEHFNEGYKDMIRVEIISFEIIFNKDYLFKTGFDITDIGDIGTIAAKTTSSVGTALLDFTKESISGSASKYILDSVQKFGYVANKQIIEETVRNHIPAFSSEMKTSRYLKNITILDATVDGGQAKSETETDIIKQPKAHTILAHFNNGNISVSFQQSSGSLISMGELVSGDTVVSNPNTSSNRTAKNAFFKDGDAVIIENYLSIENTKKYEGSIPTEWIALNALGGGSDEQSVYSQKIKLITARKIGL